MAELVTTIVATAGAISSAGTPLATALPSASTAALGGAEALAIGGTGVAAYGMYQQGQAQAAAAKGQQAIADYNAQVAQMEAKSQAAAAGYQSQRAAEAAARQQSALRAAIGASGVSPSEGSPLMVEGVQAAQSELDNLMIGYEGQLAVAKSLSQSTVDSMQASIYGQQASNYASAGLIGAGSTLLSGFGDIGMRKVGLK